MYVFFAATREVRAGALRAGTTDETTSPSESSSSSLAAALDFAVFFAGGFDPDAFRAVGADAFGKKSVSAPLAAGAAFFFLAGWSPSLSSISIPGLP